MTFLSIVASIVYVVVIPWMRERITSLRVVHSCVVHTRILIYCLFLLQVDYYVSQSLADNHAVREAACTCIAELGNKIDPESVRPHVTRLLDTLKVCFQDDSWPVRDGQSQTFLHNLTAHNSCSNCFTCKYRQLFNKLHIVVAFTQTHHMNTTNTTLMQTTHRRMRIHTQHAHIPGTRWCNHTTRTYTRTYTPHSRKPRAYTHRACVYTDA